MSGFLISISGIIRTIIHGTVIFVFVTGCSTNKEDLIKYGVNGDAKSLIEYIERNENIPSNSTKEMVRFARDQIINNQLEIGMTQLEDEYLIEYIKQYGGNPLKTEILKYVVDQIVDNRLESGFVSGMSSLRNILFRAHDKTTEDIQYIFNNIVLIGDREISGIIELSIENAADFNFLWNTFKIEYPGESKKIENELISNYKRRLDNAKFLSLIVMSQALSQSIQSHFPSVYEVIEPYERNLYESGLILKGKLNKISENLVKNNYRSKRKEEILKNLSYDEKKYIKTYMENNYATTFWYPTTKNYSNMRGKLKYKNSSNDLSKLVHYYTSYKYFDYDKYKNEFEKKRIKDKHKNILAKPLSENLKTSSYYYFFDPYGGDFHMGADDYWFRSDNPLSEYDFENKRFMISTERIEKAIIVDYENSDRNRENPGWNYIHAAFDDLPEKLSIKITDEKLAEKFRKGSFSVRINFELQNNSSIRRRNVGRSNPVRVGSSYVSFPIDHFDLSCKIKSIELHSNILGTLLWRPIPYINL